MDLAVIALFKNFLTVEEKSVSPKKHAVDRQIQSIAEFFSGITGDILGLLCTS